MPLLRLERRQRGPEHAGQAPNELIAIRQRHTRSRDLDADDRLAALGLRSVADLLAPASLVIDDDHLVVDGQFVRVLALADLPPTVSAGWLSGVLAERLPVTLSL